MEKQKNEIIEKIDFNEKKNQTILIKFIYSNIENK